MTLTQFNAAGEAQMVDVGDKAATRGVAVAAGLIRMDPKTLALIERGGHPKGDVLGVARIAGIMSAKRTEDLLPLCHSLALTRVAIELDARASDCAVHGRATTGQTGVETEALCAVQVSLLTVYDMCKAVDRGMAIEGVRLLEKTGDKSWHWSRTAGATP